MAAIWARTGLPVHSAFFRASGNATITLSETPASTRLASPAIAFCSCSARGRASSDVVLGLGGYVAFPGGMMASLLARPLALHEQNAIAGLANRVLAAVSDKVMVAFPDALKKAEWTGNPVRAQIAAMAPPEQRYARREGPIRLLVVGGSLGAQALNEAVPKALALLSPRPVVLHQAGEKHL